MSDFFNLKIVAISHFISRSGTLYLHSLLDNHPEIATIPGTIDIVELLKIKKNSSALECYEIFKKNNPKFFDTSSFNFKDKNNSSLWILGDDKKRKILTDENLFKTNFLKALDGRKIEPRNILISLYLAYAKAHNKKIKNYKIILMHPHEKKTTLLFNKFFKDAIYFIPIRNPYSAYKSIIKKTKFVNKLREIKYYPSGQLLDSALDIKNFHINKLNMYFFKLEDLGNNLETIMKKVANILNIEFNQSMLVSTFGGEKYWSNSVEKQSNEFDRSRHKDEINLPKNDIKIIYFINSQLVDVMNYRKIQLTRTDNSMLPIFCLLPMEDEINFIKDIEIKHWIIIFKFLIFYFPKRIILILIIFLNKFSSRYSYIYEKLIN